MPEHHSWFNFFPGYLSLEHAIGALSGGDGFIFDEKVLVQHVVAAMLVVGVLALFAWTARKGLDARAAGDVLPDATLTPRNLMELMMEGILHVMQFTMTRQAALRHFWIIGPMALFILFSNLLGLIPYFLPPTDNFNTTLACASVVFVYYNGNAIKRLGWHHIEHLANPVGEPWGWFLAPLFLPVEVISHMIRPVSLSVRLLCNIAGDHLVLAVFIGIFPFLLPIPFMALGLFVALVQTFVFILLSCVYIGEVEANVEHMEHLEHAAHGHEAGAH